MRRVPDEMAHAAPPGSTAPSQLLAANLAQHNRRHRGAAAAGHEAVGRLAATNTWHAAAPRPSGQRGVGHDRVSLLSGGDRHGQASVQSLSPGLRRAPQAALPSVRSGSAESFLQR